MTALVAAALATSACSSAPDPGGISVSSLNPMGRDDGFPRPPVDGPDPSPGTDPSGQTDELSLMLRALPWPVAPEPTATDSRKP